MNRYIRHVDVIEDDVTKVKRGNNRIASGAVYQDCNVVAVVSSPRFHRISRIVTMATSTLTLIILFVLWYAFNAGYNVYNSYVKEDLAFPIFVSTAQLAIGLIYALPLWFLGLRKAPSLSFNDILRLLPIGS